jgi:hypothetical protein
MYENQKQGSYGKEEIMAERRMFAMTIIDSDAFLDMPLSAQALYFHLCMRADDDGFLNNPKKIQRVIGASEKDLEQLVEKRFLISFTTGVVVIKHWRMHNYIKKDRYKPTVYTAEMQHLTIKENNAYTEIQQPVSTLEPECIQSGTGLDSQVRVRVRLGKDRVNTNTCSELPQKSESVEAEEQPSSPVYCTIITNRKEEYPITEDMVELWQESFPAVDVKQQLLSMKSWSVSNPKKRKTKNGMLAFVNNWLSKEQNRPTAPVIKTGQGKPSQYTIGNEDRWDSYKEVQAK